MPSPLPALSVLDLAPVVQGSTPGAALQSSIDLVQHAERLGYERYWVAEHHNMPGIASSQPAVLIAHLAAATSRIRVGAGGVMLPNHASLTVAEQFGMLEALHPGRIDLGLGRAPGTDPLTARALRRAGGTLDADDFADQLVELFGYFTGSFPDGHPFARIHATPARGHQPAVWLLGSSTYGAQMAGRLGLPYSFAHHFAAAGTEAAVAAYREEFRPSEVLAEPYVMLGVAAVCAESDERARWLAAPGGLAFLRLRSGRPGPYPTPEEAAEFNPTPAERDAIRSWTASHVVGDPTTVHAGLAELAARTGADELMVTTMVSPHAERVRSYELLAEVAGVSAALSR